MINIKNVRLAVLRFTWRKLLIYGVLILLIIVGVLLHQNHSRQHILSNSEEAKNASGLQQYLKDKDYSSYQIYHDSFANDYIAAKQYDNAKTVLNMVIANVPKDKIISKTYRSFWYLYQQNGDTNNRKKYAHLAAEKLRQEGDPDTAAVLEEDANGK